MMRDNHVGLCLLQKRELRQVQVVPRSAVTLWIFTKSGKRAASRAQVVQIGPECCNSEPDPPNVIRSPRSFGNEPPQWSWLPLTWMTAGRVHPDLRDLGAAPQDQERVTGDHHRIGVDFPRK